jgi:hypothetical protein
MRRRVAERQRQRARARRLRILIPLGIGAVVLGVIVTLSIVNSGPDARPGELVANLGNQHITAPETFHNYNSTPPTSGPHWGQLAPWGVSDEPLPNELQVHNLEDGGVGVQYNCPEGCPDLVAQLEEIVRQYPDRVFMAPYPDMKSTIALTAWNRIDTFEEFDAERINAFIRAYRGIDHHSSF